MGCFANTREMSFIRADTVVLAVGFDPENKRIDDLKGSMNEVYAIGDCVESCDAMEAIGTAHEIALQI